MVDVRVAITVRQQGEGLSAPMDGRFGRAERFLIVNRDTGAIQEILDNPAADAMQGAGTAAASMLAEREVQAVVSGRFGPKAFELLGALGVEAWISPPGLSAAQALDLLRDGGLERMELVDLR